MKFQEITRDEYKQFVDNCNDKMFWQTIEAANFKKERGIDVYFVGVKDDERLVAATFLAACPLKLGFKAFEANRGFYIDYDNYDILDTMVKGIKTFCKQHNGLYFRMDPYVLYQEHDIDGNIVENGFNNKALYEHLLSLGFKHLGFTTGDDNDYEPRWQFVLDLKGKDKEQILKEMNQKTRNQINATKRKGIIVRELKDDEFDIFNDIMNHTAQRRNFENRHNDFYHRQKQAFGDIFKVKVAEMHTDLYLNSLKEQVEELKAERDHHAKDYELYPNHKKSLKKVNQLNQEIEQNEKTQAKVIELAEKEGSVIVMAASFFVCYGKEVIYLYSGAYDKYLKYNPSVALQWDMISYALDNGYDRYNFYGISGNFKEGEEGFGVYNFKKGFNGVVEELMGVFELETSPIKNKAYNLLKKIKG